jgi:NhaP-type Na+/H+ or K+/H+ antiporter
LPIEDDVLDRTSDDRSVLYSAVWYGHSDDHLVELTLTALAAYGSFLIAEQLNVSGVMATLAGMLFVN